MFSMDFAVYAPFPLKSGFVFLKSGLVFLKSGLVLLKCGKSILVDPRFPGGLGPGILSPWIQIQDPRFLKKSLWVSWILDLDPRKVFWRSWILDPNTTVLRFSSLACQTWDSQVWSLSVWFLPIWNSTWNSHGGPGTLIQFAALAQRSL